MTTSHLVARLVCAATAAATTLVLFAAVISNAEPQRSVLLAKSQRSIDKPTAVTTTLAAVSVATADGGR